MIDGGTDWTGAIDETKRGWDSLVVREEYPTQRKLRYDPGPSRHTVVFSDRSLVRIVPSTSHVSSNRLIHYRIEAAFNQVDAESRLVTPESPIWWTWILEAGEFLFGKEIYGGLRSSYAHGFFIDLYDRVRGTGRIEYPNEWLAVLLTK